MTKQEAVIKYIEDNYLQFNRLRHDIVSDKLQIRMEADLEGSTTLGASVQRSEAAVQNGSELWREMTKQDINSIVCHCAQESDVNITTREVMTALQSDLIPDVHPLREYINALPRYTPDQPDWIDFVASQVKVRESASSGVTSEQAQSATEPSELQPRFTPLARLLQEMVRRHGGLVDER